MKGRPRVFKSDLVKVSLRIPENLKSRIQEYAQSHQIKFNDAVRRMMVRGLEGQCLVEQRLHWFRTLFENILEPPLFEEFRLAFNEILSSLLSKFFERNPEVLIRSISAYIDGHLNYMENVFGLERRTLVKTVAGGNPEAEKKMVELFKNIAWIKEWMHK